MIRFLLTLLLPTSFTYAITLPNAESLTCLHNSFDSEIKRLTKKARAYQPVDRRVELDKFDDPELSASEREQIRRDVGTFVCPAEGRLGGTISSAFVYERDDEIVTVAHAFGSPAQHRDLTKCYFQNFDKPPQRRYLAASSDRNFIPYGKKNKPTDGFRDRARVKLASPINGAKPLRGIDNNDPARIGQPGYAVMAQNADISVKPGSSPLISPCHTKFLNAAAGRSWLNTDCDSDEGGSGGVYLARNEDGYLYARGIISGMSAPLRLKMLPNHTPYDPAKNETEMVPITSDLFSTDVSK